MKKNTARTNHKSRTKIKNRIKTSLLHRTWRGSFTIEAAVIVPLILVLVAAMLTAVFLVHDRVIMNTVSVYEVMDHAEQQRQDPTAVQTAAAEMLEKRLITAKEAGVSVEATEDGFAVNAEGTAAIPLRFVRMLLGEGSGQIHTNINISNLDGRSALIQYKTICDGLAALSSGTEGEE